MKDKRISQIVAHAMGNLPRDLVLKCCEEDWFVTAVMDEKGKQVTIIDTEKKAPTDYELFCEESVDSYNKIYRGGFGWKI